MNAEPAVMRQSWRMSLVALQGQLMRGRKSSGLTQEQVARKLLVSRRTFQRWEDGEAHPNALELFRWADVVGVSISSVEREESANSDAQAAA